MNIYEKLVAQLEGKEAKIKYVFTPTPLSDKAKRTYGIKEYNPKKEKNMDFLNKAMKERKAITRTEFEFTFYYVDANETEQERVNIANKEVIERLTRLLDPVSLEIGTDYKLEMKKVDLVN